MERRSLPMDHRQLADRQLLGQPPSVLTALAVDDGLELYAINHAAFTNFNLWEVGNEVYGSWEIDHHGTNLPNGTSTCSDHDPATYVQFSQHLFPVRHRPSDQLPARLRRHRPPGIPPASLDNNWTRRVLTNGRNIGFVPGFYAPTTAMRSPFSESDDFLLNNSAANPSSQYDWVTRFGNYQNLLAQTLGTRRAAAGIQLMATEYNSDITQSRQATHQPRQWPLPRRLCSAASTAATSPGMVWDPQVIPGTPTEITPGSPHYGWRQGGDYGLLGDSNYSQLPSTGTYVQYPLPLLRTTNQLPHCTSRRSGRLLRQLQRPIQLLRRPQGQRPPHAHSSANKSSNAAVNEQFNIAGFTPSNQATIWQYGMTQDNAQSSAHDDGAVPPSPISPPT